VPLGSRGVLVVSNLFSESQPILRYVMGDWVYLADDACRCGRTHARAIGGLRGRSDQLIKVRGLMFFPSAIEDAVRSQREFGDEFRVEIVRQSDLDFVKVTLEAGPDASAQPPSASVAARLKGALGVDVDIHIVPCGTLPRTEAKAKRFFDLRGHS
jgi:phenylacetate-CoA ligase